ncbi:hypothetical protein NC651_040288 [Populus alba x Populus x berolinensis]|nr:hypothetical protein NC651_040288 [Populus alba x Populus x berolinensis]
MPCAGGVRTITSFVGMLRFELRRSIYLFMLYHIMIIEMLGRSKNKEEEEERRFKMDKGSSTKEEIQGDVLQICYSHSIFVEAFNALLRCLGLCTVDHQRITQESSTTSSSEQEDDGQAPEESPPSDPQADPPTDTSEDPSTDAAGSALARRTPPVSSGGGGRINSTAS